MNLKTVSGAAVELSDVAFGREFNEALVHQVVVAYLAGGRQGSKAQKSRSDVSGGGKKPFRQKGTGGARRGDMKSPLVRGGGRVFGPKPHDYNFKLNKKVKDLAKKSAFAYKAKDGNIVVVDSLSFASPKTKDFVAVLKNLNVNDAKSLILVGASNPNTLLSSRNIPNTYLTEASLVNIFDVMQAKKIVLTEDAVKVLESNFSNN